jgi:hypothetical protein
MHRTPRPATTAKAVANARREPRTPSMRIRAGLTAAASLVLLACGASAAHADTGSAHSRDLAAAQAAAVPTSRIVPIAGTGHYLVYGRYTPVHSGNTTVKLYSLDYHGHIRSLGTIQTATPTDITATAAGTVLVANKDGSTNYRWDLTTGTRTTIPADTAAAPGGYVESAVIGTGDDAHFTATLVRPSGRTELGTPFPGADTDTGPYRISTGTTGVTVTDSTGHIRFIAFDHPKTVRLLHTYNAGRYESSVACRAFTSTSAACAGFNEETTTLIALQLNGSGYSHTIPHCANTPAALHTAIAWVGCKNRLEVLHADNSVTTSKSTFGTARPVSAFGKVVLQSKTGTSLRAMTRAGSAPKTLVTTK